MIKTNKGIVQIEGHIPAVCAELSNAIKAVYELIIEEGYDDDFAKETIAKIGRLAFMSEKELDKAVEEKKKELEKLVKEL